MFIKKKQHNFSLSMRRVLVLFLKNLNFTSIIRKKIGNFLKLNTNIVFIKYLEMEWNGNKKNVQNEDLIRNIFVSPYPFPSSFRLDFPIKKIMTFPFYYGKY